MENMWRASELVPTGFCRQWQYFKVHQISVANDSISKTSSIIFLFPPCFLDMSCSHEELDMKEVETINTSCRMYGISTSRYLSTAISPRLCSCKLSHIAGASASGNRQESCQPEPKHGRRCTMYSSRVVSLSLLLMEEILLTS